MKEILNRNWKTKEGILNNLRKYIGAKGMCKVKYVLGQCVGITSKRKKKIELEKIIAESPFKKDDENWRSKYLKLINSTNDEKYSETIKAFYLDNVKLIKKNITKNTDGVYIVCVEKNEINRIKEFLKHYRKIGVKTFLICDNGSMDGTLEYLKEQKDVCLYSTNEDYSSQRKAAWCNRMMSDFGDQKWYFQVDADEFAWFPELDKIDINQYVNNLAKKNIYAVKALMLEMYPNDILGGEDISVENFTEYYCYYDVDSDWYERDVDQNYIRGGFINRIFGEKQALQCKTPLFYQTDKRFNLGSHHIYPYYEDITSKYGIILKHYKFLPGDKQRVQNALEKKNYANGSRLYKKFVTIYDGNGINPFYEDSAKWDETNVLENLPFIEAVSE